MWQCLQSGSRLQCEPFSGQEHYVLNLILRDQQTDQLCSKGSAVNYGRDGELIILQNSWLLLVWKGSQDKLPQRRN